MVTVENAQEGKSRWEIELYLPNHPIIKTNNSTMVCWVINWQLISTAHLSIRQNPPDPNY